MGPQNQAGKPPTFGITVGEIEAICAQSVLDSPSNAGYQATQSQVFFFILVWLTKTLRKHKVSIQLKQAKDIVPCVDATQVQVQARAVAQHLLAWGAVVDSLQQRDPQEWELLRIQMESVTKRFRCSQAIKDETLSDALLKVFQVLCALPTARCLQTTQDIFEFFVAQQANLAGIYDFHSPFYAYAQLIARRTLCYQLRRSHHEPLYPILWDELPTEPATADPDPFESEEKERAQAAQRLQLCIDLARLFDLIKTEMQPQKKRCLVVWHTLAARSQYWLALAMTALMSPVPLAPTPKASDTEIAIALKMSENSVRVHRNQAKSQIIEMDGICGELLETLLDLDQSNDLQWWP